MTVWKELGAFALLVLILGVLAHVLGEALPRARFDHTRFPYAAFAWEREGAFYNRLGIQRWKNRLPDKSRFVKSTVEKSVHGDRSSAHFLSLIRETCVAELVHWALLLISPLLLLVLKTPFGAVLAVLYGLSNLPFIMIQRYNRPRLARMYARAAMREGASSSGAARSAAANGKEARTHAAADPVLQ